MPAAAHRVTASVQSRLMAWPSGSKSCAQAGLHPAGSRRRTPLSPAMTVSAAPSPAGKVTASSPGPAAAPAGRLRIRARGLAGCGTGRLQGLVQGTGQRYPAVQPGQAEQFADLRPVAGRVHAAAVRGVIGRADQRAGPGGVDEADLVQVSHQRAAAGRQSEKALAQWGHGGKVNLPGGGCPLPRPRNWSGPGMPGRPGGTSAARSASGPAPPITRSGHADDHPISQRTPGCSGSWTP